MVNKCIEAAVCLTCTIGFCGGVMALLLMHVCSEIVYFLHCGSYTHMLVRTKVFWSGVKYYMCKLLTYSLILRPRPDGA